MVVVLKVLQCFCINVPYHLAGTLLRETVRTTKSQCHKIFQQTLTWPGSWMWSVKFIKCCHFSNPIHFGVSAAASKFYSLFFFFFHCLQVLSLWIKHFFWHVPNRELYEIFNFVVAVDFWSITTSFQFLNHLRLEFDINRQ